MCTSDDAMFLRWLAKRDLLREYDYFVFEL